jgi:hypothetical protein
MAAWFLRANENNRKLWEIGMRGLYRESRAAITPAIARRRFCVVSRKDP